MFVHPGSEPLKFLTAGLDAAIAQANNDDSEFGQGADGYGRRLGQHSQTMLPKTFLGTFLYPSLFKEGHATGSAPRHCVMRSCSVLWLVRRGCLTIPSGLQLQRVLLCETCITLEIVADSVPQQAEPLSHSQQI
jgi:hypothetical protein